MSHSIALVNITDGTVQGHKAGCADLTRGALRKHGSEVWNLEVDSKLEAWENYNEDFLAECDDFDGDCDHENAVCSHSWSITWLPCAKQVPVHAEAPKVVEPSKEVKRGPKWTYLFIDGVQVLEVRTELADQVLATFGL